jgi:hypothetical protein
VGISRRKVGRSGQPARRLVDEARHRDARGRCLRGGIEFAPQVRELDAQSFNRLVLHRGLASTHHLEVAKGHRLDEGAADVEAEGEHDGRR